MAFFSRGKNRLKNLVCLPDLYKDYIKDIDEKSPYYVSYKEYRRINEEYLKAASELILNGFTFKMAYSLGYLRIIKKKTCKDLVHTPIDWVQTVKLKKKVYHLNEHSRGYRYQVYWDKHGSRYANIFHYAFNFTRANKRMLAKLIKNKEADYFEK